MKTGHLGIATGLMMGWALCSASVEARPHEHAASWERAEWCTQIRHEIREAVREVRNSRAEMRGEISRALQEARTSREELRREFREIVRELRDTIRSTLRDLRPQIRAAVLELRAVVD
jgi:uncharacterized coiled-coil DUF342 family protein